MPSQTLTPSLSLQELVAVIPPAASLADTQGGRGAGARLFAAADLIALLPHVDLFSLNACALTAWPRPATWHGMQLD